MTKWNDPTAEACVCYARYGIFHTNRTCAMFWCFVTTTFSTTLATWTSAQSIKAIRRMKWYLVSQDYFWIGTSDGMGVCHLTHRHSFKTGANTRQRPIGRWENTRYTFFSDGRFVHFLHWNDFFTVSFGGSEDVLCANLLVLFRFPLVLIHLFPA